MSTAPAEVLACNTSLILHFSASVKPHSCAIESDKVRTTISSRTALLTPSESLSPSSEAPRTLAEIFLNSPIPQENTDRTCRSSTTFHIMSNWDDDDWEDTPAPLAPAGHPITGGAGLGDWDDEDAESEPEAPVKIAPAPMKPSKARAKALKEKEDEERQKEIARVLAREKEMEEMSSVERKMREQQIVEAADLENAKDLFMGGSGEQGSKVPTGEPTLDTFQPSTDAEYSKFAKMISERCCKLNTNPRRTGRYVDFIKEILRGVTKDLGPEDTKDLSTFVGLISNEKRDEQKKSRGIKKKTNKKTHVRVDRADDMRETTYDDFADDFM